MWCPVAIEPLERRYWIAGGSTLQALGLAMTFLGTRLYYLVESGTRVCWREGKRLVDVPFEALLGPLVRPLTPPSAGRPRSRRSS